MTSIVLRGWVAIASLVSAVAVAVAFFAVGERLPVADEVGHAGSHLVVAIPAFVLLLWRRSWRRPLGRLGRSGRLLLGAGLAALVVGQTLEAIGAFGFEGYARSVPALALVHDIALTATLPAMLAFLGGAVLTTLAAVTTRFGLNWRSLGVGLAGLTVAAAIVRFTLGF